MKKWNRNFFVTARKFFIFRATVKKISRHVLGECQTGKFWRVACAERKIGETSPIDDTGNVGYDQFTWMLGCELGLRIEWIFTQVTGQKIVRDEI
ncbi:hypothetical protein [Porphyromonas gingivalis]|uniref:hypothetical protein n=1 Tax=Porphyromonas gingivalis TaxID=837 RepID=UPI001F21F48E|nr:hypothetical protein [Porphyromonas gingivalis]